MADLFIRGSPQSITARYFSSNPSDSRSLRTPCPPARYPAGQRGITPVFGYSAPHPSAEGTLTLLIHALPSAHYAGSDSCLALARQTGLFAYSALPSGHPVPNHANASKRRFLSHLSASSRLFPDRGFARMSRLATAFRRNGFVILRAVGSPPVALHPASRRRSYLRLHVS